MQLLGKEIDVGSLLERIGLGRPRRLLNPFARITKSSKGYAARINAMLPLTSATRETRYLEIGVSRGFTLEAVRAPKKIGVEPFPLFHNFPFDRSVVVIESTSAVFFRDYQGRKFDFIFLDGLHESSTTYRDLVASLQILAPRGIILIDDVLPSDPQSALPNQKEADAAKLAAGLTHSRWYGDVWKVAVLMLRRYPELSVVLMGTGDETLGRDGEHCQAVVIPGDDYRGIAFDEVRDTAFMESLVFEDEVESGENSLRRLAREVTVAQAQIREIMTAQEATSEQKH